MLPTKNQKQMNTKKGAKDVTAISRKINHFTDLTKTAQRQDSRQKDSAIFYLKTTHLFKFYQPRTKQKH